MDKEERRPRSKFWDSPTLRDWGEKEEPTKETEKDHPGRQKEKEECGTLNVKWKVSKWQE